MPVVFVADVFVLACGWAVRDTRKHGLGIEP
jgi:hypothetical protein